MESYSFLLFLAIIMISTKILGLFTRKIHMPAVVGALVAGVILGPSCLNLITLTGDTGVFLEQMAEIGVILLMFNAGLETDLSELKKNGVASFVTSIDRCDCSVDWRIPGVCIFLPHRLQRLR